MKKSYKVLVVDDIQDVRNTVAGVLTDAGHLTKMAGSELEAISSLADEKFDFIVIDIRLRGNEDEDESGLELARIIRKYNIESQIIFITGKSVKGRHFIPAREYNVLAYIEKTGDWVNEIRETIENSNILLEEACASEETAQIFLSYAREDKLKVAALYQKLCDARYKPWMDIKDILPGERWRISIGNAIRTSNFFLACLSKNSVSKRGYLQKEINTALEIWQEKLEDDIYLIPVRLEECDIPDALADFQWVDLFQNDGWERLQKALRVGIERGLT